MDQQALFGMAQDLVHSLFHIHDRGRVKLCPYVPCTLYTVRSSYTWIKTICSLDRGL